MTTDPTYSCTVKVVSVTGNGEGSFGSTAVLELVQPSVGIDFTPGGPDGPQTMLAQLTGDAETVVKEGAELILTISAVTKHGERTDG